MSTLSSLSISEDDYVIELQHDKATPVWIATLASGLKVYQDDNRPNTFPASAWSRLKKYIENSSDSIIKIDLKFHNNIVYNVVPDNKAVYFFSKCLLTFFGKRHFSFYLFGHGEKIDSIEVVRWSIPSLIKLESENRESCKLEQLIQNGVNHGLDNGKS